jgi:4-hydroxybenzoate polyprenyltransferase
MAMGQGPSYTETISADHSDLYKGLIRLMRPKQWTKNLVVFAGLVFSRNLFNQQLLMRVMLAFACFCLVSSSVYIVNDLVDIDKDRHHPKKCKRPLPSGQVSVSQALTFLAALSIVGFGGSYLLSTPFLMVTVTYFALMLLYSFYLKNVVLIDVLVIAAGFVLRAWGGTTILALPISPWLLVCTVLLALFLGFSKRRHELTLLAGSAGEHRAILEEYTPQLLDQMISVVTAATIMAYSLYTFNASSHYYLMLTIPFVIYGIFRYMYLVQCKDLGGSPEIVLLTDLPLMADIILWACTAISVLYLVKP